MIMFYEVFSTGCSLQIHQMDTRTDHEKADDLIQEYLAQLELPSVNPCVEIEERLNSLQDRDGRTVSDYIKKRAEF